MSPIRGLSTGLLHQAYARTVLVELIGPAAAIAAPDHRATIPRQPGLVYEYRLALHSPPPAEVLVSPHASWRGHSIYGANGCRHGLLLSGLALGKPRTFRTVLLAAGHEVYLVYSAGWELIHRCALTSEPQAVGAAWLNPAGGDCRVDYVRVTK